MFWAVCGLAELLAGAVFKNETGQLLSGGCAALACGPLRLDDKFDRKNIKQVPPAALIAVRLGGDDKFETKTKKQVPPLHSPAARFGRHD